MKAKVRTKKSIASLSVARKAPFVTLFLAIFFSSLASAESQIAKHPAVASNLGLLEVWLEAQIAYRGLPRP